MVRTSCVATLACRRGMVHTACVAQSTRDTASEYIFFSFMVSSSVELIEFGTLVPFLVDFHCQLNKFCSIQFAQVLLLIIVESTVLNSHCSAFVLSRVGHRSRPVERFSALAELFPNLSIMLAPPWNIHEHRRYQPD